MILTEREELIIVATLKHVIFESSDPMTQIVYKELAKLILKKIKIDLEKIDVDL